MNILLTDDAVNWTDRQTRLLRIATAAAARGHGVALVCASTAALRTQAIEAGLPVLDLNFTRFGWFETARQLRNFDRRADIDVIHAHGQRDARACRPLQVTGTPIIRSCHALEEVAEFGHRPHGCRGVAAASQPIAEAMIERGFKSGQVAALDDGEGFERSIDGLLALYARAAGRQ